MLHLSIEVKDIIRHYGRLYLVKYQLINIRGYRWHITDAACKFYSPIQKHVDAFLRIAIPSVSFN